MTNCFCVLFHDIASPRKRKTSPAAEGEKPLHEIFRPDFDCRFTLPQIIVCLFRSSVEFQVGNKDVKNFRMIERHFFRVI
jgi:hypothetical protein